MHKASFFLKICNPLSYYIVKCFIMPSNFNYIFKLESSTFKHLNF